MVQFSIVDNDAYNFANNNNTTISKVDTIDLEKFYTGNEDIMNFSIFCMLAFKNFIKNSESIISRENLIIFYKLNYRRVKNQKKIKIFYKMKTKNKL